MSARMSNKPARRPRPTLDSVLRRAHLSVSLIAVLAAGLTLTAVALLALRVYSDQNLRLVARSMSYTVEGAVVFGDSMAAKEALALIGVNEDIDQAQVSDTAGNVLARWERGEHGTRYYIERALTGWMLPDSLTFPITRNEQAIGSIKLVPHSRSLLPFLLSGLTCLLACLVLSLVVAVRLSRSMETEITSPLRHLAETAHRVRRDRSFELRVPPANIAELNQINDDFNALLDELEAWQSHLQKENASLSHRANHDSLTGLSNRAFMEAELERAILEARVGNGKVAVLFLDSDRFKYINDTFGHASGDRVLVTIAARIKQQLREGDLVARLGGDEFAILLKPLRNSSDAMHIADNIIAAMAQAIELPTGNSIVSSLTIGVAVFPDHAIDAVSLVGAADEAMYRAKQAQRGTRQVARLPQPHTHP
ncbi:diguanylate cyclase domain-containing protein [Janthinobacterium lividum]|jgi:diguanylate cyclase (GGDEF)-like protein|uniref:Diguanylate cyclase n=1 Tax=Janthinobacterium lividum TaxID=29581 RepID=A0AAJ4MX45_9BURK|nr:MULTISPECIES: diguanylate cyclase [Janthinobacterium]KAB0324470.1 diguanylate cyclase [Janthinobacterium lividum]KHA78617.1 DeoR faimly transcriptional regulator [Janthinobacterium lividum]MBR7632322.1 diguanylate cyclase [Janthinobacterium lividum]MCC7698255.1 diguanylate cyclase [Janthinobacterium sp. EB271-G4-7A]MCC7716306.1 diguanylate cyclase [Janthinobacterium lividum]